MRLFSSLAPGNIHMICAPSIQDIRAAANGPATAESPGVSLQGQYIHIYQTIINPPWASLVDTLPAKLSLQWMNVEVIAYIPTLDSWDVSWLLPADLTKFLECIDILSSIMGCHFRCKHGKFPDSWIVLVDHGNGTGNDCANVTIAWNARGWCWCNICWDDENAPYGNTDLSNLSMPNKTVAFDSHTKKDKDSWNKLEQIAISTITIGWWLSS